MHETLLSDLLRLREDQWPLLSSIGDVFIKVAPQLKCYQVYVEAFGNAMEVLQSHTAKANSKLAKFLAATYQRVCV